MTDATSYMREYRKNNPQYANDNYLKNKARYRALRALAANHLSEFDELYNHALKELRDAAATNHAANPVPQRRTESTGSDTQRQT